MVGRFRQLGSLLRKVSEYDPPVPLRALTDPCGAVNLRPAVHPHHPHEQGPDARPTTLIGELPPPPRPPLPSLPRPRAPRTRSSSRSYCPVPGSPAYPAFRTGPLVHKVMSRTPRRSPAAVPHAFPRQARPCPPPRRRPPPGNLPRRTRPADNRPAGRAPATRGSRASAGTGSPAGTPPEHLDGAPTALQPAQPPAYSRAESPASAPPEHPSGTLTCSTSARRDAPDGAAA